MCETKYDIHGFSDDVQVISHLIVRRYVRKGVRPELFLLPVKR